MTGCKHINIDTGTNYKIVVISDIHAHADLLEDLLSKIILKDEDYLVILGDFINKGPQNLKTLRMIMRLSDRPRTYIMKGNHEAFVMNFLNSKDDFVRMMRFLKDDPYELVLHDMAKELNFDIYSCDDAEIFRKLILDNYKEECSFISERPIIFENQDFIMVHGGYEKDICLESNENGFLKYDNYNELSPVHDKTVIVGHWPASNLRSDIQSNLPYYNDEKSIITIDGGLGVKTAGELNGFIISSKDGVISYEVIQSNFFEKKKILKKVDFIEEDLIYVNYPHFDIEVLEQKEKFTTCKHVHSGKVFSVFNSLLSKDDTDKDFINVSYINRFLNLEEGEVVEVTGKYEDCILVKYKDEFGWILPEQIG